MDYRNDPYIKFMIVMQKMMGSIKHKMSNQWKELEMYETDFFVLFALDANGPMTIQEMAAKIDVTSGTMTYIVDKLEKRELIKRVRCEEDKRRFYLELTEAGKRFWDIGVEMHAKQLREVFKGTSEEEMIQITEVMKKIGKGGESY